jgi:hypothetical protein
VVISPASTHEAGVGQRLGGDARRRVLLEDGVEDRIRDLVGDLVAGGPGETDSEVKQANRCTLLLPRRRLPRKTENPRWPATASPGFGAGDALARVPMPRIPSGVVRPAALRVVLSSGPLATVHG